jgi:predicted nucleic acid-binding protein
MRTTLDIADGLMREVLTCGPVLAELVAGVPPARRGDYALRLQALPWSGLDHEGWLRAGLVRGDLRRSGFTASLIDVAIAVCATQAGAALWTADPAHERVAAAMTDLTLRYQRD